MAIFRTCSSSTGSILAAGYVVLQKIAAGLVCRHLTCLVGLLMRGECCADAAAFSRGFLRQRADQHEVVSDGCQAHCNRSDARMCVRTRWHGHDEHTRLVIKRTHHVQVSILTSMSSTGRWLAMRQRWAARLKRACASSTAMCGPSVTCSHQEMRATETSCPFRAGDIDVRVAIKRHQCARHLQIQVTRDCRCLAARDERGNLCTDQVLDDVGLARRVTDNAVNQSANGVADTGTAADSSGEAGDLLAEQQPQQHHQQRQQQTDLRHRPADISCAFNFGLCLLHTPTAALAYLRCAHHSQQAQQ